MRLSISTRALGEESSFIALSSIEFDFVSLANTAEENSSELISAN
jgi:hypothetical protein